ncbi:hypothetical protein D9758_007016 [Tetrapyrgos nigripes]|uniref:F-box domain-containing protein n=1 Tax=Tetrapyrgos nigripes TaxID=182062 RepID=A0A8H5GDM3_9AGAR|nr:hypothetical protein D9758_007016 [Tetrapyrgos nigripes]
MDQPQFGNINAILNLLRSNPNSYFPDISQCLNTTEQDIQRIRDEVRQLERKIVSLKAERKELEWKASQYRSLLAPIRRLPPEVLQNIFQFACLEGLKVGSEASSASAQITWVCTAWRKCVRSIPGLWSVLRFERIGLTHRTIEQVGPLLRMHLELSKPSPLYVDLDIPVLPAVNNELVSFVSKVLISESPRWRTISLGVPEHYDAQLLAVKEKLPLLHTLHLKRSEFKDVMDAFEVAPSLRIVNLETNRGISRLKLPWHQVSSFSTKYAKCGTAYAALFKAAEATEITLSQCFNPDSLRRSLGIINHKLHSLSIVVGGQESNFHHWFNWLTLPRLTTLNVAGAENDPPDSCTDVFLNDCFPTFLSRSSCTITSLSFTNLPLSDVQVLAIIASLPSLSHLTVHERASQPFKNTILTSHFFDSLRMDCHHTFSSRPSPCLTKRLQSLDLCLHGTLQARSIVEFVESRWTTNPEYAAVLGVHNLTVVKILVLRSRDAMILDAEELCDLLDVYKGLGLRVSCSSKFLDE